MLAVVTTAAICTFALLHYPNEKFESAIWNGEFYSSDIHFALVSFDDDTPSYKLTRRDALRFVSLAEECPMRQPDECPTTYLPYPGPLVTSVELTLAENRTVNVALIGDCLHARKKLVDISSKRDEITSVLWRPQVK